MTTPFTYNTNDWELHCFLDWKAKQHQEKCDHCDGKGMVGGGFGDLDDARQCSHCSGTGHVSKGPTTAKPAVPAELLEHMRRAWWDFHHQKPIKTEE